MSYIEREKALQILEDMRKEYKAVMNVDGACAMVIAKNAISKQPTADVVEVVRCKDCKNLEKDEGLREGRMCLIRGKSGWCHDNDFCSYGERREE